MSAHKNKFPEFDGLGAAELADLLRRSRLSAEDRQIAASCLVWDMTYADIGAAVNMDRSTVGRRMRGHIAPHIMRMMEGFKEDAAGL